MRRLRLLSFNLCHDYPEQRDVRARARMLADAIVGEGVDVALLQEVSVSRRCGHVAEHLVDDLQAHGLSYSHFHAAANGSFAENGEFEEGLSVLSRFPIVDTEVRRLAPDVPVKRNFHGYEFDEFRAAIRVSLQLPEGRVDAFSAHVTDQDLVADDGPLARHHQIQSLVEFLDEGREHRVAAVLGADLNATPDAAEVRLLSAAGWLDLCESLDPGHTSDAAGRPFDAPEDSSHRRIDYLFGAAEGARAEAARLALAEPLEVAQGRRSWASDHNGLVATLRF